MPVFRKEYKTLDSVKGNIFYTWLYLLDRGYESEAEMETMAGISDGMRETGKSALRHNRSPLPQLIKIIQITD